MRRTDKNLNKLYTALLAIGMLFWTILCGAWGLKFIFSSTAKNRNVAKKWCAGILWLAKHVMGITYEIRGQQYIPKNAALIASSHQSMFETMLLTVLLQNWTYVLKQELVNIPIIGFYMRKSGMIIIKRSNGVRSLRQLIAHSQTFKDPQIIIFPEGTRRKPRDHAPKMLPGVVEIYRILNLPIHPVALNSGLLWPKGMLNLRSGVITLEFLPPIPPHQDPQETRLRLKETLDKNSDRLVNELEQKLNKESEQNA
ncbi:MAG: 1-acyl-sn-glycerol-3-phosphate acyltransferase [Pseudomonadota bacterium]